jgi:kinesin family member 18/19
MAGESTDALRADMGAGSSNILVVVRCRPQSDKERRAGEEAVVRVVDGKLVVVKDPGHFADNPMRRARVKDRQYAFDHAFDPSCAQEFVYAHTTRFLIDGVLSGFNGTVFA